MTEPNPPASSPCLAAEFDPAFVDPEQARDVARWRTAERQRLLAERAAMSVEARHVASHAIADHLDRLLAERFPNLQGLTISAWWPIKAELNLRAWLTGLAARGAQAALPIVATKGAPLVFRPWTPETKMERGFWNIPVPAEGPEVTPDIALAPVVGWDAAGYRLGYGGGYFDRTLAALAPSVFAIGVGLDAAQIPTIFPQPHDIPMRLIVTETGIHPPKAPS
ncbi:MAG: 5-formyltetrahydrofolate cyclo-ligase [Rhodobacterales bacterium 17-64-5]|jgi:5-formyltetrahydrofolate cyclo-ligase|nr:MAG: 5-formyltetrahydrofolate cyclo-ligase [Rhodobacterales bacterium 17-64-5]